MDYPVNPEAPLWGNARNIDRAGVAAIIWSTFAVSTIFFGLRLSVRWRANGFFIADDYWMMSGWVFLLGQTIAQTLAMEPLLHVTYFMAGRVHLDPVTMAIYRRYGYAVNQLFWCCIFSVKASLLSTFYRLIKPVAWLRRTWFIFSTIVFLAYAGGWVIASITCGDTIADYFKVNGCNSPEHLYLGFIAVIFAMVVDVVTDLMIMALPLAMLPTLQLDIRKKVGLGVAFSLAFITITASVAKMSQSLTAERVDLVGLAVWTSIESAVAVLVGSLPPLKAFLAKGVLRYRLTSKRTTDKKPGGAGRGGAKGPYATSNYAPDTSRTVMVAESIPLDDMHKSGQMDGGIYIRKNCDVSSEHEMTSEQEFASQGGGGGDCETGVAKHKFHAV